MIAASFCIISADVAPISPPLDSSARRWLSSSVCPYTGRCADHRPASWHVGTRCPRAQADRPGRDNARSSSEERAIVAVAPRRRLPEQARRLVPPRKPTRRFYGPVLLVGLLVGCIIALL